MMPPPFDQTLRWMLGGALMSYAPLRGFKIEPPAGDFFAERAVENIKKSEDTDADCFSAAVIGIFNLPQFFSLMERTERARDLANAEAASSMINAVLALKLPCSYPWCRSKR
jgi:hypothetical protein